MKLSIRQPLGYSFLGGRGNNEDAILPVADDATVQQRWFMVCDGVGGAARGEIASHIAVEGFNQYFCQHDQEVATPAYIQSALDYVQNQFDDYLARHPEALGMATTLTLLFFHDAGATVAHIGDSRVYHLRDGKVIWRTEDHSLVNQLVRAGVITPAEAHEHPQRNVIERAIQGSSKPVKADVQLINDVRPNDYFFLCTDGVLERISDELLENVLGSDASNEQKKQTLIDCCTGKTKDNFSAYLVQVESVSGQAPDEYRVPAPTYAPAQPMPDESIAVVAVDSTNPGKEEKKQAEPVRSIRKEQTAPEPTIDAFDQKNNPRPNPNSTMLLVSIAVLATVLTLGGMAVSKWFSKPLKTGKAEQVAVDPGKTDASRPPKKHGLPPIPRPGHDHRNEASDVATVEEITQAIGGDGPVVELTEHLYKKQTVDGWILVDEKGQQKGNKVYDEIREPSDKLIAVRYKGKWGFLTLNGKLAISCQFEEASDFKNGKAQVSQKGESFEIDKTGKPIAGKPTSTETVSRQNRSAEPYLPTLPLPDAGEPLCL